MSSRCASRVFATMLTTTSESRSCDRICTTLGPSTAPAARIAEKSRSFVMTTKWCSFANVRISTNRIRRVRRNVDEGPRPLPGHAAGAAPDANGAPGHALQTTALVHEACLRLAQTAKVDWQDRMHLPSLHG